MPTMPTTISLTKLRAYPSVKRTPRDWTPINAPTETRDRVEAETTRVPARRDSPASGSSTRQNRCQALWPQTSSSTLISRRSSMAL